MKNLMKKMTVFCMMIMAFMMLNICPAKAASWRLPYRPVIFTDNKPNSTAKNSSFDSSERVYIRTYTDSTVSKYKITFNMPKCKKSYVVTGSYVNAYISASQLGNGTGYMVITAYNSRGSVSSAKYYLWVYPAKVEIIAKQKKNERRYVYIKKQSDISGYYVYVANSKNGTYSILTSLPATSSGFNVSESYYKSHWFRIRAYKWYKNKLYYGVQGDKF